MPTYRIQNGDCRDELNLLADRSVDSVVTDPPYELGFMGKAWDRSGIAYQVEVWRECLRVLKPGGHLLAFGGSRTYHRLACAIEDAGFEIRDQIQWLYGSGFPKSLDVSKGIDSAAGALREAGIRGPHYDKRGHGNGSPCFGDGVRAKSTALVTFPVSDAAKQWNGWGTALKPAHEPIVLARKPLIGTVAENVLAHGIGGLNIDGCRVETAETIEPFGSPKHLVGGLLNVTELPREGFEQNPLGRWPANVIHDGSEEVLARFPVQTQSNYRQQSNAEWDTSNGTYKGGIGKIQGEKPYSDTGSAARYFYCAKASREDREDGCESLPLRSAGEVTDRQDGSDGLNSPRAGAGRTNGSRNHHPTVKPTDLMRYLCRLVTPSNGTVLDPFCGSGSTGRGAILEGLNFIGIEIDAEYCELAEKRIEVVTRQGMLTFA